MIEIIEACQFLLQSYPEADTVKSYLDGRLNQESQERFQFGYFPDINRLKVLTSMIGEDVLERNKLIYFKTIEDSLYPRMIKFSYFDNHPLIMPYKDPYGKIVGIVGRSLTENKKISKYKNTADSSIFKKGHLLFGLYENKDNILKNNLVYIVEGQFDVIKAYENGFNNVIGLGNNNMTAYQFSVISRYTDNIILLLDNDEAGQKGRQSIMAKFGKYANIQNFFLPEGYKDIDEFLSKHSYEELSFRIKE